MLVLVDRAAWRLSTRGRREESTGTARDVNEEHCRLIGRPIAAKCRVLRNPTHRLIHPHRNPNRATDPAHAHPLKLPCQKWVVYGSSVTVLRG